MSATARLSSNRFRLKLLYLQCTLVARQLSHLIRGGEAAAGSQRNELFQRLLHAVNAWRAAYMDNPQSVVTEAEIAAYHEVVSCYREISRADMSGLEAGAVMSHIQVLVNEFFKIYGNVTPEEVQMPLFLKKRDNENVRGEERMVEALFSAIARHW